MAEPYLKNRRRFTSSLDKPLVPLFDELAAKTRIPTRRGHWRSAGKAWHSPSCNRQESLNVM